MTYCREPTCDNVKSGICLHCNQRLSAPHTVEHEKTLLYNADHLCQEVNELAQRLASASKSVHEACTPRTMMSSTSMQAVIFKGVRMIAIEDRPIPTCQDPTDVVIKVHMSALCGSELHIYRGHQPSETDFIMGHEFVGEITEVGSDVKKFKKGDKLIVPFSTSCGSCFYCKKALTSRCEKSHLFGTPSLNGGQAEYVRIPFADATAFLAPKEIPDDLVVLMADIFPTGYFAAKNAWTLLSDQERQDPNLTVVVVGCGPVGLCAITAACERFPVVYAIDSVEERLEEAKNHGAIPINLNDDPVNAIKKATEGRGADAVMEVVGHADALQLAYDLIRPWGVIASVGVQQDAFPFKGPQVYAKNVRFQFGRCPVQALFPEALGLFSQKQDLFKSFVSHRMRLSDAVKAYELFDKRLARKVVFDLRE